MAPRSVFVDTSGWYALIDRRDAGHGTVVAYVQEAVRAGTRLVTTDYVLDESCTLAKARAGSSMALRLLDLRAGTTALDLEWIDAERFRMAEAHFRRHDDQGFSFTDCTSFIVMRQLGVSEVITSDEHFRIAGFHVLPEDR
jgi:predicted nucleic acid-binding protein